MGLIFLYQERKWWRVDETQTQEQITARIVAQAATATASAVSEAASAAALMLAKENATVLTRVAVLQMEMTTVKKQQVSFETEVNRRLDNLDPIN